MADLFEIKTRYMILYAFLTNPEATIKTIETLAKSNEKEKNERAIKIHEIIYEFLNGIESDSDIKNRIKTEEKELIQYYENLNKKDYKEDINKIKSDLKLIEIIISTNIEIDSDLIKENLLNPIHIEDLNFLNKIAAISIKNIDEEKEQMRQFTYMTVKDKIYRLYHSLPYYFEQAFSNTDMKIQRLILKTIEEKIKEDKELTEDKKNNLQMLKDLNALSDIDDLGVKKTNKLSNEKAVEVFLGLLSKSNNEHLVKKILNDTIIMSSMFLKGSDIGKSVLAFKKIFSLAKYPYNELITDKFKEIMNIKDENMENIFRELSKDKAFEEKYLKYQNSGNTEKIKQYIESFLSNKELKKEEKTSYIINIINVFMNEDKFNDDILKKEHIYKYNSQIKKIIIDESLYKNHQVKNKMNEYLKYKIKQDLNSSKHTSKSIIFGIDVYDIWYDLNIILKNNEYEMMYIKYDDTFSYEFTKGELPKLSNRELHAREIRSLKNTEDCLIAKDLDNRNYSLYITSLYQKMFKIKLKDKIGVEEASTVKQGFKTIETKGLKKEEKRELIKIITDYAGLSYIMEKEEEFFKDIYITKAKMILEDISGLLLNISYEDIQKYVKIDDEKDYTYIFKNEGNIRRLIIELDSKDIKENKELLKDNIKTFKQLEDSKILKR